MTIAIRPSKGNETGRDMQLIWVRREAKCFCKGGLDRANQIEMVEQITLSAHDVSATVPGSLSPCGRGCEDEDYKI